MLQAGESKISPRAVWEISEVEFGVGVKKESGGLKGLPSVMLFIISRNKGMRMDGDGESGCWGLWLRWLLPEIWVAGNHRKWKIP